MKKTIIILGLLGCIGCSDFFEQDVNIDIPEHKSRLVIHAFVNTEDSVVRIALTKSIGIEKSGSTGERLKNVSLSLLKNEEPVNDLRLDSVSGHYLTHNLPTQGDEYSISASVPGYDQITSSTIVPKTPVLISAWFDGSRYDFDGWEYEAVKVKFVDDIDTQNFYSVEIVSATSTEEWYRNEDGTDTTVYYEYENSVYLYSAPNNMIHTSAGSFFNDAGLSNVAEIEVWVDKWNIPSQDGEGQTWENHDESGEVIYRYKEEKKTYVRLRNVTESHYEYKTVLESHLWNQYPDLFSGEPIPMYSNIENGYGVFSSYTSDTIRVSDYPRQ